MQIVVTASYEESCEHVARLIAQTVRQNPAAKIGLATGSTPLPVYRLLAQWCAQGQLDFSAVRTVNLDEYCTLPPQHPQSYRYFMDTNLFDHINIDKANTFVPDGTAPPQEAAAELEQKVFEGGAPDIQLLGIGNNGHLAFNEAGPALHAHSHVEPLSPATIAANARFFANAREVPQKAITMGMKGILASRCAVLLATGQVKATALRAVLQGDEVTPENPATFLKLHPGAVVVLDCALAAQAGYLP